MRTPSITASGYTSPQHTDVQATWRKFGWIPKSEQGSNGKVIDGAVKLLILKFENQHKNDRFIGPVPNNVKQLRGENQNGN